MKKICFAVLIFSFAVVSVFATAQAPDLLVYNGKTYYLFSNPLESFYDNNRIKRPKFWKEPQMISSGNWRGYVASWEITNNKLFLTNIDSWFCDSPAKPKSQCNRVTIKKLFGKKVISNKVFASWVSENLRVPDGEELQYVHMGYGSIYERDIIFKVKDGKVIKQETIDNTKRKLPSQQEIAKQELEKLNEREKSAESNVNSTKFTEDNQPILLTEKGWGKVSIGNKRSSIDSVLGKGETGSKYDDVYFVEYPKKGVQISYTNKSDEAYAIFFYNKQTYYGNFTTAKLTTDKGITWNSTPDDIIKAYGKPPRDFSDESGNNAWRRLEYDQIDFLFEWGKMTRIGISNKKCTGCKK